MHRAKDQKYAIDRRRAFQAVPVMLGSLLSSSALSSQRLSSVAKSSVRSRKYLKMFVLFFVVNINEKCQKEINCKFSGLKVK